MTRIALLAATAVLALAACGPATESQPADDQAAVEEAAPLQVAEAAAPAPAVEAPAEPAAPLPAPAQLYMDPNHTQISAEWKHFSGIPLRIAFTEWDATINYNPADPSASSVAITLPIAGLDSGVPAFTDHLKSPDFFEADTWPTASFTSTSITKTGDNTATMTGDLTIKDNTAPVTFDVTLVNDGANPMTQARLVGFTATTVLDRTEWGLGMFSGPVPADVTLNISTELTEAPPQ